MYTPSLITSCKKKERYWVKWKTYNNRSDYDKFSTYRRRFNEGCSKCFNNYIKSVEDNMSKNIKYFWSFIKNRRGHSSVPPSMYYKDDTSADPKYICNLFSNFFYSVYEPSTLDSCWAPPSECNENNNILINDIQFDHNYVKIRLKNLDATKGPGPDGIPALFFKETAESLHKPITHIYNACLQEGIFPNIWKKANIIPVYKSGDKHNVENYRPISILSTLSKVFESLIHSKIYPSIQSIIIPEQHGFVKRRSTATNLTVFTNDLFESMDRRLQVHAVYTDFKKAFDKIDHKLLLDKIAFNGIRGNLLRWFISYVTNRTQKVLLNGFESDSIIVTSGIPQGSILGPLIFILFINDIYTCFKSSKFLLYADDLKVYKTCYNVEDCNLLQEDLNNLSLYCIANKLQLSLPKCNSIIFTKKINIISYNYELNGEQLTRVYLIRDLGVMLDAKLHLESHIDTIISKAFRMYGFVMRSSREFKNKSSYLLLYKTLVRSQVEYAVSVWHPLYKKYSESLETVQRKFLRSMHYRCHRTNLSYSKLLNLYNILSLESRRISLITTFLYNICNNKFDCTVLCNKLCYIVPKSCQMRKVCKRKVFYTRKCNNNAGIRAPLRRAVDIYNTYFVNLDIFSTNLSKFKREIFTIMKGNDQLNF